MKRLFKFGFFDLVRYGEDGMGFRSEFRFTQENLNKVNRILGRPLNTSDLSLITSQVMETATVDEPPIVTVKTPVETTTTVGPNYSLDYDGTLYHAQDSTSEEQFNEMLRFLEFTYITRLARLLNCRVEDLHEIKPQATAAAESDDKLEKELEKARDKVSELCEEKGEIMGVKFTEPLDNLRKDHEYYDIICPVTHKLITDPVRIPKDTKHFWERNFVQPPGVRGKRLHPYSNKEYEVKDVESAKHEYLEALNEVIAIRTKEIEDANPKPVQEQEPVPSHAAASSEQREVTPQDREASAEEMRVARLVRFSQKQDDSEPKANDKKSSPDKP